MEWADVKWLIGVLLSAHAGTAVMLWRYFSGRTGELLKDFHELEKRVNAHDERMRQGITYVEADRLIDLKLEPLRTELRQNTDAVKDLTQELRRQREG